MSPACSRQTLSLEDAKEVVDAARSARPRSECASFYPFFALSFHFFIALSLKYKDFKKAIDNVRKKSLLNGVK